MQNRISSSSFSQWARRSTPVEAETASGMLKEELHDDGINGGDLAGVQKSGNARHGHDNVYRLGHLMIILLFVVIVMIVVVIQCNWGAIVPIVCPPTRSDPTRSRKLVTHIENNHSCTKPLFDPLSHSNPFEYFVQQKQNNLFSSGRTHRKGFNQTTQCSQCM